jgi:hypothetical protein
MHFQLKNTFKKHIAHIKTPSVPPQFDQKLTMFMCSHAL